MKYETRSHVPALLALLLAFAISMATTAQAAGSDKVAPAKQATKDSAPVFDEAFLTNDDNIAAGEKLWVQCRHCHGRSAYPGKAPKLKPRKYKPSFVYKRITKGFRKMPAWEQVFSQEERMALVAYILSPKFSP